MFLVLTLGSCDVVDYMLPIVPHAYQHIQIIARQLGFTCNGLCASTEGCAVWTLIKCKS